MLDSISDSGGCHSADDQQALGASIIGWSPPLNALLSIELTRAMRQPVDTYQSLPIKAGFKGAGIFYRIISGKITVTIAVSQHESGKHHEEHQNHNEEQSPPGHNAGVPVVTEPRADIHLPPVKRQLIGYLLCPRRRS